MSKKLFILSGIPGSGKSYWSENFKKEHENTYIISSDDIRMEIGGSYQYFKEEKRVWDLFVTRADELSKNHDDINVILDSTALKDEYRLSYLEKLRNFDKYILVLFRCKFSDAVEKNEEREEGKVVPLNVMKSMGRAFHYPSIETKLKFDEIIEINNKFR